jgi:hypothetical protein
MGSKYPQFEALSRSQIFLDYQRAFTGGTGLPLALHGTEMLGLVRYRADQENPFCSLMGMTHKACAACYALQQELAQERLDASPAFANRQCPYAWMKT